MNGRPCGLQLPPKRIVIRKLQMIRFGMGVSGRAHGLEIGFCQWRLVSRERATTGRATGRKQDRADSRECDNDGKPKVFQGQGGGLLTHYSQGAQPKFLRTTSDMTGFALCQVRARLPHARRI